MSDTKLTQEVFDKIRQMHRTGYSNEQIAEETGLTYKSVSGTINQYHMTAVMPSGDFWNEALYCQGVSDFWADAGFYVEVDGNSYGYTRSNLLNGLPKGVDKFNPKKHGSIIECQKKGLENFKKKQRERGVKTLKKT